MGIPIISRVVAAARDLRAFFSTKGRHKYVAAILSILITGTVVWMFYVDSRNIPYPERIIYVQNWPANRTDDQIRADQKRDAALKKQAIAARQADYKRLADQFGIK